MAGPFKFAVEPAGAEASTIVDFKAGPVPEKASHVSAMRSAIEKCATPCTQLGGLGIPKRNPILGSWFKEGDLGFIFAPRGLGKTWLALGVSTAIAGGKTCGPWQAHGARRVLYVDGEMPAESVTQRIEGMGGDENLVVLNHEILFHLAEGLTLNLANPHTQEALLSFVLASAVQVLVLDNLSCLFSGVSENDADSWEGVKHWLLKLRRHRVAVVVIHHAGRNKEMRGTSRREDDVFWIIRLDETGGDQRQGARFLSRFTKDRNSQTEQQPVEWQFVTGEDGVVRVTTRAASSLDVFRQWIEDGLTSANDLALEMGVSKGTISKWAKKAIEAGWLTKEGRGYALV